MLRFGQAKPALASGLDFSPSEDVREAPVKVNDIHSGLNETDVAETVVVDSLDALRTAVMTTAASGGAISIAGGRHAMGGQQFASDARLLDMRGLSAVLDLDREQGLVEVEAGIQWPDLVRSLLERQTGAEQQWGITQKQTGADRFTIGGSISANGHGRGLTLRPLVGDVESLRLVTADGSTIACSREENAELFRLVIGGYGLFGAIYSVTLRLAPRRKLERVVELAEAEQLERLFAERIAAGYLYGDFQFAIDPSSEDFLHRGVFSCYRPVADSVEIPAGQRALTREDWGRLLVYAHTEKTRAFEEYADHYLATSGQLYWSDLHQFADYTDGYHEQLDRLLGSAEPASEMISELYVPRERLSDFLADVAEDFRGNDADVIYGTVRLIERDEESFLAWARQSWACVIFNLHTVHTREGISRSTEAFRGLIDRARERGGSYFLTYHRWARREQVEDCYPQFRDFLRLKRQYDPTSVFESNWYRHHLALLDEDA
jgi:FAD/FMN-containing dehydrogenase